MNYIVIPAYQPDNKLITLIEKIHEKSDFHILVIDDGSSSKCQKIFDKAEQYATVLRHQGNQGFFGTLMNYHRRLLDYENHSFREFFR